MKNLWLLTVTPKRRHLGSRVPTERYFLSIFCNNNRTLFKQAVYRPPGRYPSTQTTRSPDQPNIPGGPAHKLATNYYFDRDHRRNVAPPTPIYKPGESAAVDDAEKKYSLFISIFFLFVYISNFRSTDGKSYTKGFDKGPSENFGLGDIPTPGVGCKTKYYPFCFVLNYAIQHTLDVWTRSTDAEEFTQKKSKVMAKLQHYDGYR